MQINIEKALTPRQLELLALYASGYDYAAIGTMKFLSYYTVRNTLQSALERVPVRNLTHLCALLVDSGILRQGPGAIFEPVIDERVVG